MQIQKVNTQQSPNFGARQVILTKKGLILNTLALGLESKYMFRNLALRADEEGFYHGLLVDGAEKRAIDGLEDLFVEETKSLRIKDVTDLNQMVSDLKKSIASKAGKPKVISRWQDLLELPIFAKCKDKITKLFENQ